jgi:hypothetical protein
MDFSLTQTLVRTILEHAEDYPWRMQDIGLLGLRLDDRREHRLHVWGPTYSTGDPPVHDHPYDFTSLVVVGEMTNTRYVETRYVEEATGEQYTRVRYSPADEDDRATDSLALAGTATVFRAGDEYSQLADELHDSRQLPGTVTIIRMAFRDVPVLSVCTRSDAPWMSGRSRPAKPDEIKTITRAALGLFV